MNKIYIDVHLKHPFIDNLKELITYTDITIMNKDVSNVEGLIFTSFYPNLKISEKSAIVICYETKDSLDFSGYVNKIWWDFIEHPYFVSVLNMTESNKFLGDSFNLGHSFEDIPSFNNEEFSTLSIANAYSFCTTLSDSILYSVITSASYRKKVYNFFEKNCLNIEENSIYKVKLVDDYSFYMHNLSYLNKDKYDLKDVLEKLVPQIKSFSKLSRVSVGDTLISFETLDSHFLKYFDYIDKNNSYSKQDLADLRNFYMTNREKILSFQSFAQNNCNLKRCVTEKDYLLFDYFSIYSVKEHYSSYLVDLGQLLISVFHYHDFKLTLQSMGDIYFYNKLLPKEHRKFIYFFALLEDVSIQNTTLSNYIKILFDKELT